MNNIIKILYLIIFCLITGNLDFDYYNFWDEGKKLDKEQEYLERNKYNVFIPDKEYGNLATYYNVIDYKIKQKTKQWQNKTRNYVYGKIYQVEAEYFNEDNTLSVKENIRRYLVGRFKYFFKDDSTKIKLKKKPVNPNLPVLPKNQELPSNTSKWCNRASTTLNKDICMIESSTHQLQGTYNKTLGRELSGRGKLTRKDLKHPVFKKDPVLRIILDYKPIWNLHCKGIDKKYHPTLTRKDRNGADKRLGTNSNQLTVGKTVNYFADGIEKLPTRTSSDRTFYADFLPYYTEVYSGRNINTRREYKITLFLYEELRYYSKTLDAEGWYGKLYPKHKYKGREGKQLRGEVKKWLENIKSKPWDI